MAERGVESFDGEGGGVMLSRGQTADGVQQIGARQLSCLLHSFSGKQLRQDRSTDECRRAAVREISCCFDLIAFDDQR